MNARTILLAALGCLATAPAAFAQPTAERPLVRADVHGAIGWGHLHRDAVVPWGHWDHRVVQASGAFGWYWSDHLKTEVELTTATPASFHRFEYLGLPGAYRNSRTDVRGTSLGVVQQYQFARNAWVHPFVGAGVELRREARVEHVEPVLVYDSALRNPGVLEAARRIEWPATWRARAVAEAGLKTYFSERAFARFDVKVAVRDGVDEVVLRAGVGFDLGRPGR